MILGSCFLIPFIVDGSVKFYVPALCDLRHRSYKFMCLCCAISDTKAYKSMCLPRVIWDTETYKSMCLPPVIWDTEAINLCACVVQSQIQKLINLSACLGWSEIQTLVNLCACFVWSEIQKLINIWTWTFPHLRYCDYEQTCIQGTVFLQKEKFKKDLHTSRNKERWLI
jgi:hypothetical protein